MNTKKTIIMLALSLALVAGLILVSQTVSRSVRSRYNIQQPAASIPLPPTPEKKEETPPSDTFYDAQGNAYTLDNFKDRPVVLSLWSVNKGKSSQNLKFLEEAYREYGDQIHFVVIHVTNENATKEQAAARLEQDGCTFPAFYDPDGAFLNQYEKNKVPLTLYFQKDLEAIAYSAETLNDKILQSGMKAILPQS